MNNLGFSLSDYQLGLLAGQYLPPDVLCPYYEVDPVLYHQHSTTDSRRADLRRAMDELRKRTGREYFRKTYPLQAKTLSYSAKSFPAYRFILPEVMTEDWLSIVDWGKFQRDHVLHQPLCGYVVLKLLDGDGINGPLQLPGGQTFLDRCVDTLTLWKETAYIRDFLLRCGMRENHLVLTTVNDGITRNIWCILLREAAYMAAVFHDMGYPWQYTERLQGNLDEVNTPALKQNRSAAQVVQLFNQRLLYYALQGYQIPNAACPSTWNDKIAELTNLALTHTHGLPGALGFLHLNDCVRRYPSPQESPLRLLCVEWAATAIMMHDMVKIYWGKSGIGSHVPENPFLRLSFDRDPISAIVTLADIIQEFERPAVVFNTIGNSSSERVTLQYDKACSCTKLELDSSGVLTLRYQMDTDAMRAIKRKSLIKESHEYFDSQYGYLDMSGLGITEVRMTAE